MRKYTNPAIDCCCTAIARQLGGRGTHTVKILGECGECGGNVVDTLITVDVGPDGIRIHACLNCKLAYHA